MPARAHAICSRLGAALSSLALAAPLGALAQPKPEPASAAAPKPKARTPVKAAATTAVDVRRGATDAGTPHASTPDAAVPAAQPPAPPPPAANKTAGPRVPAAPVPQPPAHASKTESDDEAILRQLDMLMMLELLKDYPLIDDAKPAAKKP